MWMENEHIGWPQWISWGTHTVYNPYTVESYHCVWCPQEIGNGEQVFRFITLEEHVSISYKIEVPILSDKH